MVHLAIRWSWTSWGTDNDTISLLLNDEMESPLGEEGRLTPEQDGQADRDEAFRIAIPTTGGLDSSTLYFMAKDQGLPVIPYYVHLGQEYAELELYAAKDITNVYPRELSSNVTLITPARFNHIIPGRNAAALTLIARDMTKNGWGGEVWFGGLGGESPARGGDKSSRYLTILKGMLMYEGHLVSIERPLLGMDKPDLITWLARFGYLDRIRSRAKSCFDPKVMRCGRCQACFRFLVAFVAAREDWHGLFPNDDISGLEPFSVKYLEKMGEALLTNDFSHYSKVRSYATIFAIQELYAQGAWS